MCFRLSHHGQLLIIAIYTPQPIFAENEALYLYFFTSKDSTNRYKYMFYFKNIYVQYDADSMAINNIYLLKLQIYIAAFHKPIMIHIFHV
jgi:hypothetical protein